jgi:hypothetical protein
MAASELPSLKDLDPHPGSDAPKISTPSSVKSRFRLVDVERYNEIQQAARERRKHRR